MLINGVLNGVMNGVMIGVLNGVLNGTIEMGGMRKVMLLQVWTENNITLRKMKIPPK